MARRIPIRFKLTAALAVPMATLLVVASSKVLQTRQDAREAGEQAELALFATGPRSLLRSLQTERNHTGAYLLDVEDELDLPNASLREARPVTDDALDDFQTTVDRVGGEIHDAFQPALDAMVALEDIRARVDAYTGPRSFQNVELTQQVFGEYSNLINALFDASAQISVGVSDPVLRRGAELVTLSSRGSDTVALITRELLVAAAGGAADGVNTPEELGTVARLLSRLRDNQDAIRANAVGPYRRYVESFFASEHTQRFPENVQRALDTGAVDITGVFSSAGDREGFGYDSLLEATERELETEADRLTGDASRTQNVYLVLGILGIALAVVVTWLVSRSITRPLRALTRQAKTMAHDHLPAAVQDILETPLGEDVTVRELSPVTVNTRDEVADVAAALTTVQDSALELAVEQAMLRRNIADSFVNLGRRNQNLLSRQLDFITELERNETDPDVLGSLFRLDHLATRMRRNAESLLVLAGIEPPRKWAAPVRLTDVIRSALGEVEDYHRVSVRSVEPATIMGSAAADLAHLIAELVENALTFSPPDQAVEVRGQSQPSGYSLAIMDYGMGMPPDELERANRRLAGTESFTIAPSKYLGHYVAGNLAARHGIEVELRNSPSHLGTSRGITAVIELPPALLMTGEGASAAASSPPPRLAPTPAPTSSRLAAAAARTGAYPSGGASGGLAAHWAPPLPPPGSGARGAPPAAAPASPSAPAPVVPAASAAPAAPAPPAPKEPAPAPVARLMPRTRDFPLTPPPDVPPVRDLGSAPSPGGPGGMGASGGLTRRVPGAQLPDTRPLKVQRVSQPTPAPAQWAAPAPEDRRSPDDIRSYLSRFSAGVRHGRDEAQRQGYEDDPGGGPA